MHQNRSRLRYPLVAGALYSTSEDFRIATFGRSEPLCSKGGREKESKRNSIVVILATVTLRYDVSMSVAESAPSIMSKFGELNLFEN